MTARKPDSTRKRNESVLELTVFADALRNFLGLEPLYQETSRRNPRNAAERERDEMRRFDRETYAWGSGA